MKNGENKTTPASQKDTYYAKNRERMLKHMNKKYQNDPEYREATKKLARERYQQDPEYRRRTIERAKERHERLRLERIAAGKMRPRRPRKKK